MKILITDMTIEWRLWLSWIMPYINQSNTTMQQMSSPAPLAWNELCGHKVSYYIHELTSIRHSYKFFASEFNRLRMLKVRHVICQIWLVSNGDKYFVKWLQWAGVKWFPVSVCRCKMVTSVSVAGIKWLQQYDRYYYSRHQIITSVNMVARASVTSVNWLCVNVAASASVQVSVSYFQVPVWHMSNVKWQTSNVCVWHMSVTRYKWHKERCLCDRCKIFIRASVTVRQIRQTEKSCS